MAADKIVKPQRRRESQRYLLIQVRDRDDPMRPQEITCFARACDCDSAQLTPWDLLSGPPNTAQLSKYDAVFIGGSGHYSATTDDRWLQQSLGFLRDLATSGRPVFASCWGFQALSRALGGVVVHDLSHAELGTRSVSLTECGRADPVFGDLFPEFPALMGHEDCVTRMPEQLELLAISDRANQAFRLRGFPVYGTQFHPELTRTAYLERVRAYPKYIKKISGLEMREFEELCSETPECSTLIGRFIDHCAS